MKGSKNCKKQGFAVFLALILLFTLSISEAVFGAEETKIMQGTSKVDFWTLTTGTGSQGGWTVDVLPGESLTSATWSSESTGIFTVSGSIAGATVTPVAEGYATLHVQAATDTPRDLVGDCFLSVVTPMSNLEAKAGLGAVAYVGAKSIAGMPSASLANGRSLTIKGTCGNFYWVQLSPGITLSDGKSYQSVFVAKTTVTIPATGATLNETTITVKKSNQFTLLASMLPALTTDKTEWLSDDYTVAKVNDKGVVTGVGNGKTKIWAATNPGYRKLASCTVTVTNRYASQTVSGSKITGKYQYGFYNSSDDYFKEEQLKTYFIPEEDQKKLVAKLYTSYGNRFSEDEATIQAYIEDKCKESWGGSCYGMAATVALNRAKQVNVKKLTNSKGAAWTLHKAKKPKNNTTMKSIINCYQVSQWYTRDDAAYYDNKYDSTKVWQGGLKNLVNYTKAANQKKIQLFTFHTTSGYNHAILIKAYKGSVTDSSKKTWFKFSTYDPSYPKSKVYVYVQYTKSSSGVYTYKACKVKGAAVNYGTVYAYTHTKNFGEFKNIKY